MDNLVRIDNYVNDLMSVDEKRSFELELKSNAALKKEVDEYQSMIQGIKSSAVRKQLQKFAFESDKRKSKINNGVFKLNFQFLSIAASIALLVGFFFVTNSNHGIKQDLSFESFYYVDPGQPVVMGEVSDVLYSEAMNNFKNGNYEKAKVIFDQKCQESTDREACYYLAQCQLNLGDLNAASLNFKQLSQSSSDHWQQKSEWYLAYLLWKNKDLQYLQILESIRNNQNHLFYQEARQIE